MNRYKKWLWALPALLVTCAVLALDLYNPTVLGGVFQNVTSIGFKSTNPVWTNATPTILSGFGTGTTVTANNGTASFLINVGTGGTATTGSVSFPVTAAQGYRCSCVDTTTANGTVSSCKQTGFASSSAVITNFASTGSAAAWVASDVLALSCEAI